MKTDLIRKLSSVFIRLIRLIRAQYCVRLARFSLPDSVRTGALPYGRAADTWARAGRDARGPTWRPLEILLT